MNFKLVFKLAGKTLLVEATCMLLPLLVALFYRESVRPFLLSIAITTLLGLLLTLPKADTRFNPRDGFFSAGLIWLLVGLCGALPFYFCGYFPSFVDCIFEAISGFTTTGATILTAVESLPRGILFWRAFTHWMGGMGILVLAIALLPSLGARTLHVMKAESPGPIISKLVPKSSQSSQILYTIYLVLTLAQVLALRIAGMGWFDAVTHALATAGTGGFSTRNLSVGAFASPAIEIIIGIFMILFSVNFAMYFLLLCGKWRQVLKSDELRFFGGVVGLSVLLIALNIQGMYDSFSISLRHAFFQVASLISTTGFSSVNFDLWPEFSRTLLVLLMTCGACAGSTAGGMKCSRVLLLIKCIRREIRKILHPRSVNMVRLDGKVVEEDVLHTVMIFLGTYMLIACTASLVVSLDNFSFTTSLTAVLACISNAGPGLEQVGPMGNFFLFSPLTKLTLSLCMIVGRLEIFPILVLFSKSAWQRV